MTSLEFSSRRLCRTEANTPEVFSLFNEAAGTLAQHRSTDSETPIHAGLETQSQHDDVERWPGGRDDSTVV